MSFCCLLLSALKLDYCNMDFNFYITVIFQIVFMIVCIYIFIKKRPDYLVTKEKYINEWKEVQRVENERDEI